MELPNLYLWLNAFAVAIPILLSFDKKVAFYRSWRFVIPSIILTAVPFIIWDVYFTQSAYWGFNEKYLSGVQLFGLPLAEVLFFITVPYSCVFIYECLKAYLGDYISKAKLTPFLWIVIGGAILMNTAHPGNPYTLSATALAALIAFYLFRRRPPYTNLLIAAFIISIMPFLLMNGILTGTFIEEEVVWYNVSAFSGWRILTIPVEDFFYSFSLIAINIILSESFRKSYSRSQSAETPYKKHFDERGYHFLIL